MNKTQMALAALIGLLLLGFGLLAGALVTRLLSPPPGPRTLNTATIITQVQGLAQLVTVKYVMEKVVVLEDVKVYGESRVLLIAHGVVKAGVDLSRLKPGDLSISGKKIVIRVPAAAVTDAYLDDAKTQVLEHSTGLLRRFDKDLQQTARQQGLDEIRRTAKYNGIIEDANQRAGQQLKLMFQQLGFDEVEIKH